MLSTSCSTTDDMEKRIGALRQEGNSFFSQGKNDHAVELYQRCLDLAEECGTPEARKLGGAALANASLSLFKQQRFDAADNAATLFLETAWSDGAAEDLAVKVLFRRAMAREALKRIPEAIKDLRQAQAQSTTKPNAFVDELLTKLVAQEEAALSKRQVSLD